MRRMLMLWAGVWLMVAVAAAQGDDPQELVRETTERVLGVLEENEAEIKENPERVYELVNELVLPHFDFELMSRFVLARHWRTASEEQRERFVEQFRELLVRTYGSSLAEYSGQTVEFLPKQSEPSGGRVTVRTEILQPNGPEIPLDYVLHETDGNWKVFDVVVEGVSLVQNYRSSFGSDIRRNGLDALIEKLEERNAGARASQP